MVKWSSVRCSFYFQKSCNMPFHSISVCASTEHPRSNTISGSIFMLYAIFHLDGFLYLFSNIKSDLKPLRNTVLVFIFPKKFFFFWPNAGRERRASFLLPHADENMFSSFSRDGVLWESWVYASHFAQAWGFVSFLP